MKKKKRRKERKKSVSRKGKTNGARKPTYLLMRREDRETGTGGLVLLRCTEGPEGNWSAAKLGEPALQFGLSSVVRQAGHV